MSTTNPLGTYLNDHLAGAALGINLIARMRSRNRRSDFESVLAHLEQEIRQDREVLKRIMTRQDVTPNPVKQAGGWASEKLLRIKMHRHVTGSTDLSRLMEAEALSLGIDGKLAGWRALKRLPAGDDLGVDLDVLIERAIDQRARLELLRTDAATRAFASRPD